MDIFWLSNYVKRDCPRVLFVMVLWPSKHLASPGKVQKFSVLDAGLTLDLSTLIFTCGILGETVWTATARLFNRKPSLFVMYCRMETQTVAHGTSQGDDSYLAQRLLSFSSFYLIYLFFGMPTGSKISHDTL